MSLTPASLRLDLKCGKGSISEGEKCTKGPATKAENTNSARKALAIGLTVTALGAGAFALSRRGLRPSAKAPITPPGPPRLPDITPKALLKPAPPRQSKTQRMRENTAAAIRNAEARIAQTAREETRRLAQISNTMASAGEAAGMATKLTARNVRLRVEAARRKYEPGYRAPQPRRLPGGIQAQLPQQSTPPEREAIPINPRTGQPRRRKARGFGRTDNFIQHYAPVHLQPPTRRDAEDGKKYTKTVTNPETGRKNRIRYGAKGYKIAPGTDKGDRYCARSFGDMKSHGKDCAGADRNTPLCLSRAKWRCSGKVSRRDEGLTPGKVLGLARIDAPKGGRGKPCGASHIPRQHKCSKNTGPLTAENLKTAAKVALAVGALTGGAYLTKRGMMSMDEWRKSPQSARNNPKLSPEKAQQIADEAIAGGQKWDVQEKINARRQADLNIECGFGLGKALAPAKFDAAVPNPRCQAGAGAFGTYFVHPSQKYGVKLFRGDEDDVGFEFDMLDRARAAGVNAPDPLAMNATRDRDGEIQAQTLVMSHMKGYKELGSAYPNSYGNADEAPLITQVKIAREFRKLHTEGLAHGDIHAGNIMVNTVSKKPAIIDFGYATSLDSYHPGHGRSGIQNLMKDLNRLPEFFGLPNRGDEFLIRYKGVLANIETQATNWDKGVDRRDSWERFELGVKRYHDALEAELLWEDRKPRSRFISGADQPRIPGLTRRILTANVPAGMRTAMERDLAFGTPADWGKDAKLLGVKPARLFLAFKPERDARLARQRQQPFGTPISSDPSGAALLRELKLKPQTPITKVNNAARLRQGGSSRVRSLAEVLPYSSPRVRLSLAERMQRIMKRSGNENMSLEAARLQARNEQRGYSSWKE